MDTLIHMISRIQIKKIIYPIVLALLAVGIAVTFALVISSLTFRLNSALNIETKSHDISFSMTNFTTVAKKLNISLDSTGAPTAVVPSSTPATSASSSTVASSTATSTKKALK